MNQKPAQSDDTALKPSASAPQPSVPAVETPAKGSEPQAPAPTAADDDHPHLELEAEHQAPKKQTTGANIIAPELPAGVELPHTQVVPQSEPQAPREKVDFENLPEFVRQRRMLRNTKIGVAIGFMALLIGGLYLGGFIGKKTYVPITDELKKEKTTDELIKKAEDKPEEKK